jgi:hypothetical protein
MDRVPAANQQDRDDKSRYNFFYEMVHGNGSFGQATPFSSRPIKVKNWQADDSNVCYDDLWYAIIVPILFLREILTKSPF